MKKRIIGKINKNNTTDLIIQVDEYKGNMGLTIREYLFSKNYSGFTKAGVRIKGEDFAEFKELINSINEKYFDKKKKIKKEVIKK